MHVSLSDIHVHVMYCPSTCNLVCNQFATCTFPSDGTSLIVTHCTSLIVTCVHLHDVHVCCTRASNLY